MNKLPQEIDDLMWEVAENETPELMDDFAARYPEHKQELLRRIKMVRGLKGARPKTAKPKAAFKPRPYEPPKVTMSPWGATGIAAVLIVTGVMAGIGIQSLFFPNPPQTIAVKKSSAETDGKDLERSTWIPSPPPQVQTADSAAPPKEPESSPGIVAPMDMRITVINERARLSQILNEVAVKAGIKLQAAPGMPEMDVAVEYRDQTALAILNDLGRTCGFTPLRQTDTEALLIPTVDRENPPRGVLNGSTGLSAEGASESSTLPAPALSGRIGR